MLAQTCHVEEYINTLEGILLAYKLIVCIIGLSSVPGVPGSLVWLAGYFATVVALSAANGLHVERRSDTILK